MTATIHERSFKNKPRLGPPEREHRDDRAVAG
jgi:hypothetical protein